MLLNGNRLRDPGALYARSLYWSAVTFVTVGFGDIVPTGPLRLLAGMEALTGFVLITWTASFLYLEMNRLWRQQP